MCVNPVMGKEGTLIFRTSVDGEKQTSKRGGPPNRMNDLAYRDWMKFQKSFVRFESDQKFIEECVYFFTKALWDDGSPSRILIVGAEGFSQAAIPEPRVVTHTSGQESYEILSSTILSQMKKAGAYDFVLVDLRTVITEQGELDDFINVHADRFFDSLRAALSDNRYCCVMVGLPEAGGGGFPFPWAVALAARMSLRLRDEKVGLVENERRVFYSLFMQANDDGRPKEMLTNNTLRLSDAKLGQRMPPWIIPKPPPRRKNEILHPAKFPETLIEQLIKICSSENDNIFDPMVGTGSTVISALRTGRNGFGIDLSKKFIQTATYRIEEEQEPSLFGEVETKGRVFIGDATRLDEVHELDGIRFRYTVTSPPYWSMLTNPGSENQQSRRNRNLPLVYSDDENDLGNVVDYDEFLNLLESVYASIAERLLDNGMLTVLVKNVKRKHILYPLAWDLTSRLCGPKGVYNYVGTTLWCQDDVRIKPFAVGTHWVSNILHTYCLHFQKREDSRIDLSSD